MTRCLPVLGVLFTMLSCVHSQPSVIIGTSSMYFDFSAEYFQEFHTCLCGADRRDCVVHVGDENRENLDYDSWLYYDVTNINTYDANNPTLYSDRYECSLRGDTSTGTLYSILCERQFITWDLKGPPASFLPCQTIHVSCSERCVEVLWNTNHSFWLRNEDSQLVGCGSCELETSNGPTATTTTTTSISTTSTSAATSTTTTTSSTSTTTKSSTATKATTMTFTSGEQKGDDPTDDNISLVVGVVVAIIVVLVIAGIIIVIWWRRKRNSKLPSISHHYVNSTEAVSRNYAETRHGHEHVGGNGQLVTNPFVTADNHSTEYYNTVGEDEYSAAKYIPANSNMSAQYSFAGPGASPLPNQNSETFHNSISSSQPTTRNSYGYEEVDVNTMSTQETPAQVYGDDNGSAEASKEPNYTNVL